MSRVSFRLVVGVMALGLEGCEEKPPMTPTAPPVVFVVEALSADKPSFKETVATLEGSTETPIQAQVSGYLLRQCYIEGSLVKPGDLLFQIDPRPFQADLDQALATLASKQARKGSGDRAQPDIALAQAAVQTAKINLNNTRITSPTEGVAGRAILGVGDFVRATTTLTTVSTADPIQADFTLASKFSASYAEHIAQATAVPLADRPAEIELILADGTVYPLKGRLSSLNRQIQTKTGAVAAGALFPNPDRILRPGQYVRVRAMTLQTDSAVLIPPLAVSKGQGTDQVWVVKDDNSVQLRRVTLGERSGSLQTVVTGLKAGERVVVEGIEKCRDGWKVTPQPYVSRTDESAPTTVPASTLPPKK